MEPTKEDSSLHCMKLGGVGNFGCILDLRHQTAQVRPQLISGIQVSDTGRNVN